jgi:hypothetical protein
MWGYEMANMLGLKNVLPVVVWVMQGYPLNHLMLLLMNGNGLRSQPRCFRRR